MDDLNQVFEYVVKEYADKGYEFWKALIGQDPIVTKHPLEGKQVEISPIWDGASQQQAQGRIRVLVSILHTAKINITLPTRTFLVHPDGSIVHDQQK
jgi:hypothetical protein